MIGGSREVAVVGGGIAGLALGFHLAERGLDVVILEGQDRAGGNIRSERRDGYLLEWGPNGFLDNEPATLRLIGALGLDQALAPADPAVAGKRWIVRDGKLRSLPTGPPGFLLSDVLSLGGRLRVLLEWTRPARRDDGDESVLAFATRRIGREAAEVLVDAMVTGVYAGDPGRLSVNSAFPKMREMEREHGSLLGAMVAKASQRARQPSAQPAARAATGGPNGPGGRLTSLHGGMERLVAALVERLGGRLRLGCPLAALSARPDGRFGLALAGGELIVAKRVVLACPAWAAAPMVARFDAELAAELAAIESAPVVVVATGFRAADVAAVARGFGYLIPGREGLPVLGTLFDSWVFAADRAPPGHVLWRTMLGGSRHPGVVALSDEELIARTLATIRQLTGVTTAPVVAHVIRHPRGIPQYPVGHGDRLRRIEQRLARLPGLMVAGNSYRGIAMNACIKDVEALAGQIAAGDP